MDKDINTSLINCLAKYPEIQLFMLFGSRARNDCKKDSDWDFGYIATPNFNSLPLETDLIILLKTDNVDLVNLSKANGLLRYRVAKDGKLLYQQSQHYEKFWLEAVHFWCDAGPIIRAEYNALWGRIA